MGNITQHLPSMDARAPSQESTEPAQIIKQPIEPSTSQGYAWTHGIAWSDCSDESESMQYSYRSHGFYIHPPATVLFPELSTPNSPERNDCWRLRFLWSDASDSSPSLNEDQALIPPQPTSPQSLDSPQQLASPAIEDDSHPSDSEVSHRSKSPDSGAHNRWEGLLTIHDSLNLFLDRGPSNSDVGDTR